MEYNTYPPHTLFRYMCISSSDEDLASFLSYWLATHDDLTDLRVTEMYRDRDMSAIHNICEGGKAASLRLVLPYVTVEDADVLSQWHQRTPLQFTFGLRGHRVLQQADTGAYIECVRLLLEKGVSASPNYEPGAPDVFDSWTFLQPLHMACSMGCVETVKLLLNARVPAKVNTVSTLGSPLHILRSKVAAVVQRYDLLSPFRLTTEHGTIPPSPYHLQLAGNGVDYTVWNGGRYSRCIELVMAAGGKDHPIPTWSPKRNVLGYGRRLVSSYA